MKTAKVGFVVSALSSLGLAVVYAAGGHAQLEGLLLALSLGGLGTALAAWGLSLPGGEATEERHLLESTSEERESLRIDWEESERVLTRRSMLRWAGAAFATLGAALLFPIRSLGPSPGDALKRTAWSKGARLVDQYGRPVKVDDLDVEGVITVFPEGHVGSASSQTILIRVDPSQLQLGTQAAKWAPQGYVAYSKVCTHAGCPVGLFEQATNQLLCPCHQSTFDVLAGAKPVFGPATRALPQLPITIDADGFLLAEGDFPEPVGPGFWNRGRPA